ncbi:MULTISPECIES: TraC family protein [Streptomyces]|uniref:type VI secretion protein n=1 Tax=Streptomyces TaxID=1883 RepID=UPI00163B7647|nr:MULTISPECIES: type VI secretion protein [Streptomyces]MBC2878439.1 type VI secretion protein [Streptomyces sp. TYQ1024]UBI38773.1 type VI secretion protein [Streptomyces mobaraensis]UKW31354.1 type VI secretion protein [Streptomyces sp. TYQ1024]
MALFSRRRDDTSLKAATISDLFDAPAETSPAKTKVSARDLRRSRLLEDPAAAMRVAPKRGWSGPFAGRAASLAKVEVVRADTERASGIYPFLHAASLPPIGVYMGWNTLTMQAFSAHPAAWVREGLCTNPNVMITGIPGSGKSAHIKALCFRLMALGHRTLIAGDVKGEYRALCEHLGVEPVRLGPGLTGRLNPLDAGPLGHGLEKIRGPELKTRLQEIHRRRLTLLKALLELQLKRTLKPQEEECLDIAVREVTGELHGQSTLSVPTLPLVYERLKDPTDAMARELRVRGDDVQLAREQMTSLRSALGGMITGHLGGLFDQQTSIGLDWQAPIQSVDISALEQYGDETVAMVLTCVSSWAQSAIDRPGERPWIVVRDELWRQMRSGGAAMVRKIDADLRLSRATGTIQLLATHRLSDFEAVGSAGSEAVAIAKDLIASCETRIQLAQDTKPLNLTREAIGLTDAECDLIGSWGAGQRGRALWKVGRGGGSHAVQLMLSHTERKLFETDERMVI